MLRALTPCAGGSSAPHAHRVWCMCARREQTLQDVVKLLYKVVKQSLEGRSELAPLDGRVLLVHKRPYTTRTDFLRLRCDRPWLGCLMSCT